MILISFSCLSNSGSLYFSGHGTEVSLVKEPGVKAADEGGFILLDDVYSTPVYNLKKPWLVGTNTDSFYIQYSSISETILEMYFDNTTGKEFVLPGSDGIIRYQAELSSGNLITGFRVRSKHSGKDNKSFKIMGVGIETAGSGLSVINSDGFLVTKISPNFQIVDSSTYTFEKLSKRASNQFNQVKISLSYSWTGTSPMDQELILFSDNHNKSFGLNLRHGETFVHFYSKSLGFIPTGLTVKNNDPEFTVTNIDISSFSTLVPMDYSPVPADVGTILNYKPEAWRRSDWELFSWNLFPDILIIDFRDYAIQAETLKRLSFFVEKKGFAGELLDDEILSRLHGWNAHDYRSEDLAAFFSKAENDGFILNSEECNLKSLLLSNNIIVKNDKGYGPVTGGILSYSTESSPRLRRLFITHEGYHGIFFSDPEFVLEVQTIWDSLEEPERSFWYSFLGWKRYDTNNSYLIVNEFMAYLMQQSIANVESYYKDYIIPSYIITFPDRIAEMKEFLLKYPDHFLENAKKVEDSVYRLNSISAGELRCLY